MMETNNSINTWLKLAKKHHIVAPKYTPEQVNTLAFGIISIPETEAMLFTISFLRDGNPKPVDNLCETIAFAKFMRVIENDVVKEIQSLNEYNSIPDGYFEIFGSKSAINLRIREVFRCNRGFFMPQTASVHVESLFTIPFVHFLKGLVGVDLITLEKDTPEYHTQVKFL